MSEDGAGRSEKGFSPDFFQNTPPHQGSPHPASQKGGARKKYFFTIHNHCCSPAIAGGIVVCFHGLCEAGTQIKAIKGFVPRAVWRVSSHGRPYTQSRRGGNAPICRLSSVGRAPVSKTGCHRFKSCKRCHAPDINVGSNHRSGQCVPCPKPPTEGKPRYQTVAFCCQFSGGSL